MSFQRKVTYSNCLYVHGGFLCWLFFNGVFWGGGRGFGVFLVIILFPPTDNVGLVLASVTRLI